MPAPLTRRRFLRSSVGLVAGLAAVPLLVACGQQAPAAPANAPKPADTKPAADAKPAEAPKPAAAH